METKINGKKQLNLSNQEVRNIILALGVEIYRHKVAGHECWTLELIGLKNKLEQYWEAN